MISAKESREIANKFNEECSRKELEDIMRQIDNSAKCGRLYISGTGYLKQNTKNRLKELGYKVDTGSQYNELYYCISWKDTVDKEEKELIEKNRKILDDWYDDFYWSQVRGL